MAGGNSPRAKMIGMMYLVLTALLALNISKEIVQAFVIINEGIETTTENFEKKNGMTYAAFNFQESQNPAKVKPYNDKAKLVKKMADELEESIEVVKRSIIAKADKLVKAQEDTVTLAWCVGKDDTNIPAQIMVGGSADGKGAEASKMKEKIEEFKVKVKGIISQVSKADAEKFKLGIETEDPPMEDGVKLTWEMHNFGHYPLAPVITLMSKLQSDVRNTEADAINYLISKIDASSFKFDALEARVIAKSGYVFVGQDYEADVFVAAFSTTQNPEVQVGNVDTAKKVIVGNAETIPVELGMGKYKKKAATEGIVKWGGVINVKSPDGKVQPYFFKSEYIVAKPSAVISPEKMNVLYIGLDNPVSISVGGGIADEKITPSISNGTLTKIPNQKGHYMARVTTKGEAVIRVTAEVDGKKGQAMGEMKFRAKDVPDPIAKVAGKKGGVISKAMLSAQAGVAAELENFDFEGVRYVVTSFTLDVTGKGKDIQTDAAKNNAFTSNMQNYFSKLRAGDLVIISDIKAIGPGGNTRNLGSVTFKII